MRKYSVGGNYDLFSWQWKGRREGEVEEDREKWNFLIITRFWQPYADPEWIYYKRISRDAMEMVNNTL